LPVVLHGIETWSRTDGRTFAGVLEKGVWREVFGFTKEEITVKWRTIPNEELYDLYCSPNIRVITRNRRWAGIVACM
jgi:hypothetical protein